MKDLGPETVLGEAQGRHSGCTDVAASPFVLSGVSPTWPPCYCAPGQSVATFLSFLPATLPAFFLPLSSSTLGCFSCVGPGVGGCSSVVASAGGAMVWMAGLTFSGLPGAFHTQAHTAEPTRGEVH